jgi:hypothetical protein
MILTSINTSAIYHDVMSYVIGAFILSTHLVSSFATANVNHDVTVRKFRNSLRDHCFATTKSAGYSSGSTLYTGEERIQNTLAGQQGVVRSVFLRYRARRSHRPDLHHLVLRSFPLEFCFEYNILYIIKNECVCGIAMLLMIRTLTA